MGEETIQGWIDKMQDYFIPEKAAGIDTSIQLHLSGDEGGDWAIVIKDQKLVVTKESLPAPRLTLGGDAQDVLKILSGQMDGMRAFMQGKVKVSGDMGLAMKMMNLFNKPV
jgi:putative sterol carrier protein